MSEDCKDCGHWVDEHVGGPCYHRDQNPDGSAEICECMEFVE